MNFVTSINHDDYLMSQLNIVYVMFRIVFMMEYELLINFRID